MAVEVVSLASHTEVARKRVSILGATGSIGMQTVGLLKHHASRFEVEVLTAQHRAEALVDMAQALTPKRVVIGDPSHYQSVKDALSGLSIEVMAGQDAIVEAAAIPVDIVVGGIVGMAGLRPVLSALQAGNDVALANKEPLVAAGDIVTREAAKHQARLLPVDSEHNAIFQIFDSERVQDITAITLTASGGPFRDWTREAMAKVTPAQAVAHPNWDMGAKISVDSATLMNKGLECIEAYHLFPVEAEQIKVLIHPESVVHGLVSYIDGTVKAVLSPPDMATPIASALAWPERIEVPQVPLDLTALGALHFEAPDMERFPALRLAREALVAGGGAPAILNAANEVAVAAFLEGWISFLTIPDVVAHCLDMLPHTALSDLDAVIACDRLARETAVAYMNNI